MSSLIRTLINSAPVIVRKDDDLALALQVMTWADVRHLPVMGGDALVGVLSERDILRRYAGAGRRVAARERVGLAMSSPPVTIGPDDDVASAIKLVTDRGIGCLPVVETGRLLGIVTRRDLLAHDIEPGNPDEAELAERLKTSRAPWSGLLVDDVMSREPLAASPNERLQVLVDRMERHGIRHLPVVDVDRRVIGMLSDRDVRSAIGNPMWARDSREAMVRIEALHVAHAMTRSPLTLHSGTRLSHAASMFADHKVGALPIVDEADRLVGLVSYTDVLRAVLGPKRNVS